MTPSCSASLSPARGLTPTDEGFSGCVLGSLSLSLPLDSKDVGPTFSDLSSLSNSSFLL